jgi:hypothetical protein
MGRELIRALGVFPTQILEAKSEPRSVPKVPVCAGSFGYRRVSYWL